MDPAKVKAWQRFFDEVVAKGGDWPRALWFAAVDDALAKTLGSQSDLVIAFRRDLAELTQLEGAGSAGPEDEQRRGELEAEIRDLIETADATIMAGVWAQTEPESAAAAPATPAPAAAVSGWTRAIRTAAFGLLVLGTGLLAAVYLYDARLAEQVDRTIGDHLERIEERIVRVETDLARRARVVAEESERLTAMRAELEADIAAFDARMATSLERMTALHDDVLAGIERRLAERSGAVRELLSGLEAQTGRLGRGLDQVGQDLVRFQRRVPELGDDLDGLSDRIEQGQAAIGETVEEIAILRSLTPELIDWVRTKRAELDEAMEKERVALRELETRIAALKGRYERSNAELEGFRETLREGEKQAKADGEALERKMDDVRASGDVFAGLAETAEDEIELAKRDAEKRIDTILEDLAKKADLAAMRGDDMIGRAEERASRRIEAARDEAVAALGDLRARELARLDEDMSATRAELERTQGELVEKWQDMDRTVAAHRDAVVADLDGYAATVSERIRELVDALDLAAVTPPADANEVATTQP